MELTKWFPCSMAPARVGIYETRWTDPDMRPKHPQYQYWNGSGWGAWGMTVEIAERNADRWSARQQPEWRGLAKQPK